LRGSRCCLREHLHPFGDLVLTEQRQAVDVPLPLPRQDHADRRDEGGRDPPAAQDHLNERPSRPAISIFEGVNRLELRVRYRGLQQRWKRVLIAELAEVVDQVLDFL